LATSNRLELRRYRTNKRAQGDKGTRPRRTGRRRGSTANVPRAVRPPRRRRRHLARSVPLDDAPCIVLVGAHLVALDLGADLAQGRATTKLRLLPDLAAREQLALDEGADEAHVAVDDVGRRADEADEGKDGDEDEDNDEVCARRKQS